MENSGPLTILVVENVGEISSQMEAMLHRKGHRALLASDAAAAIKIAETVRPALILTDIDLPNFASLVRTVRTHATLKDVVIAIIDINDPHIDADSEITALKDFSELDRLLASIRPPIIC